VFNYAKVPVPYMADGIRLYLEEGIPPGSFLTAVLSNDLMEAAARADVANRCALFEWARWLHNEAPIGSYGSRKAVIAWFKKKQESL
jgi:hypothetical protein